MDIQFKYFILYCIGDVDNDDGLEDSILPPEEENPALRWIVKKTQRTKIKIHFQGMTRTTNTQKSFS